MIPRLLAVLLILGGCSAKNTREPTDLGPITVTYRFENVRASDRGNEWSQYKRAIVDSVIPEARTEVQKQLDLASRTPVRTVGEISVQSYAVELTVPTHHDVIRVKQAIRDLADRPSAARPGEVIGQVLVEERLHASFGYTSGYAHAGVRITVSGQTDPEWQVVLSDRDGDETFRPGPDGTWSREVRVREEQKWIYGYASVNGKLETSSTQPRPRWFRVNIATGRLESIESLVRYLDLRRDEQ